MITGIEVTITGDVNLQKAISDAIGAIQPEMEAALIQEGEMIMAKSQEIVPVDDAILKGSGGYYGSEFDSGGGVTVRYGYGGAASGYAVIQHETPPGIFSHKEGQSWKYLELPTMEAVQGMGARIGASLSRSLASRFGGA